MIEQIFEIIGQIVLLGGGASVIAYGSLRLFLRRWLDHRFDQSLEEFKRKQSELLEQTRYEINTRFDRITKIHEKEFEVLPKAWKMLQDAYGRLIRLASPLQQWPELDRFSDNELEAFLENCELQDFQKEELRQADDKLAYYQEKAYWVRLNDAIRAFYEFRDYLRSNKIFLSRDLFDLFSQIEKALRQAKIELEHPEEDEPWTGKTDIFTELESTMDKLLEDLEISVQKRLHFDQTDKLPGKAS